MQYPTMLPEGETWINLPSSLVTVTNVSGSTTYYDGVWNGKDMAMIRIGCQPSSVSQASQLANINVGTVECIITINGKNISRAFGNGSSGTFGISAYIASNRSIRTRTYGQSTAAELSITVFCLF